LNSRSKKFLRTTVFCLRQRVAGMGDDLLDPDREADDPDEHRKVAETVDVAHRNTDLLWGHLVHPFLERFLEPAEVGPPQQAGNQQRLGRAGGQLDRSRVARHRGARDDQRFAERDDHEQGMPLRDVADVDVPRASACGLCRKQVREDGQQPDPRTD